MTPALPRELQVEVTGACNLRCRMCLVRYRPPLDRVSASLGFDTFRRLVDGRPGLEKITLQGLGEPLLAPDLVRMIAYAAGRGIRAGFNTNGTLLTARVAGRLVDAGLDWLHVSVDGARPETYEAIRDGASFAKVARNVQRLSALLRERQAARPALSLVCVAMRRTLREIPDLVSLAAEWGVPTVRVQNLAHSFSDTGPGYQAIADFTRNEALWDAAAETTDVFAEARRRADALGIALRLPELHDAPPRAAGTPGCDWPWRSAYVRHDGRVQPCCMLMGEDRAILGDVTRQPFAEVWAGDAYEGFRSALLGTDPPAVCRGCSMYRGIF